MNKHDRKRVNALLKTLEIAKSQVEVAALYLTVNGNDKELLWDVHLAGEHVENAIDRLNKHDVKQLRADKELLAARPRRAAVND